MHTKSKYPTSHRSANAKKGHITKLKNRIKELEAKLWALEEKCEDFMIDGCPNCGESFDVRDVVVEDEDY